MAKMHSRKRGKARSHRPTQKTAQWVKYKPEELEEIIKKLAKQGNTNSAIGLILRDTYGVPLSRPVTKKRVSEIANRDGTIPEDLFNLIRKAVNLHDHMANNKRDYTSKRGLELTESKIRRLVKYYTNSGKLQKGWKYTVETARLLVK